MAAQSLFSDRTHWNSYSSLEADIFSRDLSHHGLRCLEKLSLAIDEVAPRPGLLVYVAATKLALPSNGLDPVLFSAIDVCTHLQAAQAYHSLTTASAVSFVEFAAARFPFPVSQIRTLLERPFHTEENQASHRDFSVLVGRKGYIHFPIADPERDAIYSVTSKLHFNALVVGNVVAASSFDLQREVGQFLFFHNNYRTIPWLGGKTPLQRLRSFERFRNVHSFSAAEECEQFPSADEIPQSDHNYPRDREIPERISRNELRRSRKEGL